MTFYPAINDLLIILFCKIQKILLPVRAIGLRIKILLNSLFCQFCFCYFHAT